MTSEVVLGVMAAGGEGASVAEGDSGGGDKVAPVTSLQTQVASARSGLSSHQCNTTPSHEGCNEKPILHPSIEMGVLRTTSDDTTTTTTNLLGASPPPPPENNNNNKLPLLPLIFIIFYGVSGGPFGIEDTVGAAGPLLALAGFLVFPFIWSVPEALITAELATMFPENGGYVVWVSSAFGPYWGFQQGWTKWISGVVDNALYPVLFLDYLKSSCPSLAVHGLPRTAAILGLTGVLTLLNYYGMVIVGWAAVALGAVSILPFIVLTSISIPKLKPSRWLEIDLETVNWRLYLNTLFWNLNYWDGISTLAGEVKEPRKKIPTALFCALVLVVSVYFFPLLAGTGAADVDRLVWTDGYFADVATIIGGAWLSWWVQGAAAMSNMGMFMTEMSGDSFQLLGMAERGMLPEIFAKRSRFGTPVVGILFSASGVLMLSWLSFDEIVAAENFLYCFGMIMEFAAFVTLRVKRPTASRPFRVPVGTVGSFLICVPPVVVSCVVLALSSVKVLVVSLVAVVVGLGLRPGLKYVERKRWMKFSTNEMLPDLHGSSYEFGHLEKVVRICCDLVEKAVEKVVVVDDDQMSQKWHESERQETDVASTAVAEVAVVLAVVAAVEVETVVVVAEEEIIVVVEVMMAAVVAESFAAGCKATVVVVVEIADDVVVTVAQTVEAMVAQTVEVTVAQTVEATVAQIVAVTVAQTAVVIVAQTAVVVELETVVVEIVVQKTGFVISSLGRMVSLY
ncbi:hypothetical protein V2J09_003105 [Rumex salicifolius]